MANKKQKRREELEKESLLWSQRWQTADSEQAKLFEKMKDYFDVMYAVRSYKNMAPWRSKIYIPILAGKAWDFIAKLADVEPRFVVTIRDEWELDETGKPVFPEEVNARAERISKKMDFDYKNAMQSQSPRDKIYSTLIDTVVAGSGFVEVTREVEEKNYKAHEATDENGNVNMDEELLQTITEGSNGIAPDSVFNWKFAPATNDVQSAPWIIHDGLETLDELKRCDEYDQEVLAQIDEDFQTDSDPTAQYSASRNRLLLTEDRVAADTSVKFLKTHKTWHRNEDGEVVIQKWVEGGTDSTEGGWSRIQRLEDPFWHNKYNVQGFYIRRKPYSVWGESLFENNETLQYASNDVFNHYMDNLNLSLDGMIMMDENAYVEDFVVGPGEVLIYKNEQPKQFKFTEPNPGQLSMVMNTLNQGVEGATVSNYASGDTSSQSDKTQGTATGVSKIMEAAQDKLGFMKTNFKSSLEGVGYMWLLNDQQFMDRQAVIPTQTPDGMVPSIVTPLDMQGIISLTIDDDSMTPVSKSGQREMNKEYRAEVQAMVNAATAQAQIMGTPEDMVRLDYRNLIRDVSFDYSKRSYAQYILPNPAPKPAEAPVDPPSKSLNYKDAPEDVKRQMEQEAGYQPSEEVSPQGIKDSQNQTKIADQQAMDVHTVAQTQPVQPKMLEGVK